MPDKDWCVVDDDTVIDLIPNLRRFAWIFTVDRGLADDLVEAALRRAVCTGVHGRGAREPRVWLFAILHDVLVDRLCGDGFPSRSMPNVDPENAQLAASLDRLPFDQRAVLVLAALEDFSFDQIADITGTLVGTVSTTLVRACTAVGDMTALMPRATDGGLLSGRDRAQRPPLPTAAVATGR